MMSDVSTDKKLKGKDLITIGIFSAIYFVINFAFMLLGGIHPVSPRHATSTPILHPRPRRKALSRSRHCSSKPLIMRRNTPSCGSKS